MQMGNIEEEGRLSTHHASIIDLSSDRVASLGSVSSNLLLFQRSSSVQYFVLIISPVINFLALWFHLQQFRRVPRWRISP